MSENGRQPGRAAEILEAAFEAAVDHGLRRLTVAEIARRAGVTKVTLYAYFPSKDAIVTAMIAAQLDAFFTQSEEFSAQFPDLAERIPETFAHAFLLLREHPLVRRILRTEPETLIPYITEGSPFLTLVREWVRDRWSGAIAELSGMNPNSPGARERIALVAELVVRLGHSLLLIPESLQPLQTQEQASELTHAWIMPVIRAAGEGPRR